MAIQKLTQYTKEAYIQMASLVRQLSERCVFTENKLKATIEDRNCYSYVLLNGEHIIGCATICVFHSPTGTKSSVEDVVVAKEYRGQHHGKMLMEYVLNEVKKYAPIEQHLTSNPKRVAANKLC